MARVAIRKNKKPAILNLAATHKGIRAGLSELAYKK